jgi:methionine sulfoxide reductase heme-binding subunit
MMIAASTPSPLWFATRGAGTATLLLLTAVVVLGVVTAGSAARSRVWPRFLSAELHRNLSLFTVVFLIAHIVLAVADPYAHLGWKDAAIPFASAYRPFWLGLGVIAGELFVALIVTSLLRPLLGFTMWRTLHWLAYASWPVAMLHSLGTGTDAPARWSLALAAACALAVTVAIAWRLAAGKPRTAKLRIAFGLAMVLFVVGTSAWAADGPLRPGWARRAGTPVNLIGGNTTAAKPTPTPTAKPSAAPTKPTIQDQVAGTYVHLPSGQTRLLLTDLVDPSVQFVVRSPGPGDPGAMLAVVHSGQVGCIAQVSVQTATFIAATCGKTTVEIVITPGTGNDVTGRVIIQAV